MLVGLISYNNINTQICTRQCSINQLKNYELQSALALEKFKFLSKLKLSNNMCVNTLTNVCIMQDLDKIVSKFEIDVNDHFHSIKNKLLFDFGSTLSLS